eukprot:1155879-Pelagomonas_calceolata.AAC.12
MKTAPAAAHSLCHDTRLSQIRTLTIKRPPGVGFGSDGVGTIEGSTPPLPSSPAASYTLCQLRSATGSSAPGLESWCLHTLPQQVLLSHPPSTGAPEAAAPRGLGDGACTPSLNRCCFHTFTEQMVLAHPHSTGAPEAAAPRGLGDGAYTPLKGARRVVAVVGTAHVKGIVREWPQAVQEEEGLKQQEKQWSRTVTQLLQC